MMSFHRIVVPIDFSEASDAAWRMARALAGRDTTIVAVNVVTPPYPDVAYANIPAAVEEQRRESERRLTHVAVAPGGARVEHRVMVGDVAKTIVAAADDGGADLVVIGLHAHHGLDHFLRGSVAETVIRDAPCHVLVAKPARAA